MGSLEVSISRFFCYQNSWAGFVLLSLSSLSMVELGVCRGSSFLLGTLESFVSRKQMDVYRIAEVGSCLLLSGFSAASLFFSEAERIISKNQRGDGGWTDVEESMWCLLFLKHVGHDLNSSPMIRGYEWLRANRNPSGGWGKNSRDFPRIPLTSLMIIFHPEIVGFDDVRWLVQKVNEDLSEAFFLTYKVSMPLYALAQERYSPIVSKDQTDQWIERLSSQQNPDGGFAPWKGHPSGSDIVSSGYALLAFGNYGGNRACLDWILKNQFKSGIWPYHYIEHGVCVGVLALTKTNVSNEK